MKRRRRDGTTVYRCAFMLREIEGLTTFQFGFSRCDRVVAAVLARIGAGKP
jgi:hypothetical protein